MLKIFAKISFAIFLATNLSAMQRGNMEVFGRYIELDEKTFQNKKEAWDNNGNGISHYSVAINNKKLLKDCVDDGYYSPREVNKNGVNLLHAAVFYDRKDFIENSKLSDRVKLIDDVLSEGNVDPNQKMIQIDEQGFTPFVLAVAIGNVRAMAQLWKMQGGCVLLVDESWDMALNIATKYHQTRAIKYIIKNFKPSEREVQLALKYANDNGYGKVAELIKELQGSSKIIVRGLMPESAENECYAKAKAALANKELETVIDLMDTKALPPQSPRRASILAEAASQFLAQNALEEAFFTISLIPTEIIYNYEAIAKPICTALKTTMEEVFGEKPINRRQMTYWDQWKG